MGRQSFIFGCYFVIFSAEKMNSDANMKLLRFARHPPMSSVTLIEISDLLSFLLKSDEWT